MNLLNKIFNYIDFKLGRFFYKNDNNFLINFIGNIQLKKKIFNFEENQKSLKLSNIGFTKIDSFEKNELQFIKDKLEECSKKSSKNYRFNLDINDEIIIYTNNLLQKNESLISTLRGYFKSNYLITEINVFRNKHFKKENNKELINENFHCDHYKKTMVKLFINLSNVTKENGPLEIFAKENTKKIIENGFKDRNNYGDSRKILDDTSLKFINIGDIGHSFLCNTTECLHRASIPHENCHRDMLAVTLFKDFSNELNPLRFKNEINKSLAKKLGKLNFT